MHASRQLVFLASMSLHDMRSSVNSLRWSSDPSTNGRGMASRQDFGGPNHDLSETFTAACVRLEFRECPLPKTSFLLGSTLSRDLLPPAL